MSAPVFSDIGKIPRDTLNNGYHFGLIKLDCTAKTKMEGVTVNFGGAYTLDSGKLGAYIGAKSTTDSLGYGIKYCTDLISNGEYLQENTLTGDVTAKEQFMKFSTDCTIDPTCGEIIGGHIKNTFKDEHMTFNLDTDVKKYGPFIVDAAAAIEWEKFIAGYQLGYDAGTNGFTKNNIGLQYSIDNITLAARVEHLNVFGVGVGCKLNEDLDVACDVSWNNEDSSVAGALGAKYDIRNINGTIRAKIDQDIGLGLSYTQVLHENITATACASVDCKNIAGEEANHKIGLAVEVQI